VCVWCVGAFSAEGMAASGAKPVAGSALGLAAGASGASRGRNRFGIQVRMVLNAEHVSGRVLALLLDGLSKAESMPVLALGSLALSKEDGLSATRALG